MSSTTAGLHKLLHVQDTGRPISSVKGIQLQPTQRDSSFQLSGTTQTEHACHSKPAQGCFHTERYLLKSQTLPTSRSSFWPSQYPHSHLNIQTLVPEDVITDNKAAVQCYYGVPGCLHDSTAVGSASCCATPAGTVFGGIQKECSSWYAMPRLKTVCLSLPSALPGRQRPLELATRDTTAATVQQHLSAGACHDDRKHSQKQGHVKTAVAPAAAQRACFVACMQQIQADVSSTPTRINHQLLTLSNNIPEPLQQRIEQLRQAEVVSGATRRTAAGTCTGALQSVYRCLQQPQRMHDNRLDPLPGLPDRLSSGSGVTQRSYSFRSSSTSVAGSAAIGGFTGQQAAFASSCNGGADVRKTQSGHGSFSNKDLSYVAADIAAILHIQLGEPSTAEARVDDFLQELLASRPDSPPSSKQANSRCATPALQQGLPDTSAAGSLKQPCAAGSDKHRLHLPLSSMLPQQSVSPIGHKQPIVIDSPRPVGRLPSPGVSEEPKGGCQPGERKAICSPRHRPPNGFAGHEPGKVCAVGGMTASQSAMHSVFSSKESSAAHSATNHNSHSSSESSPVSLHAAGLVADAAVAGANEIGGLLQHVLQLEPKDYGGPSIALSPWRQALSSRADQPTADTLHSLTAWKRPQ